MNKFVKIIIFFVFIGIPAFVNANTLSADSAKDAYKLIENAGFGYEVPDNSREHALNPVPHIKTVYDEDLKKYAFAFQIHALIDDDRGIAGINDRQRVEIKTHDKSPENLLAKEGETLVVSFKMRIPKGFKTTDKFCHFHQLKGIDNKEHSADVRHPLITLTACSKKDGSQKFELRYFNRKTQKMSVKTSVNFDEFLGNWVEVVEKITFGKNKIQPYNGNYSITITRLNDKRKILDFSDNTLDLWQTDCAAMRPKWGIYRSIGVNRSFERILKDEEVRFNDFSVEKI